MAVTKLSNSGIKTGVLKYDSMLAGNPAYIPAAYEFIATALPSGTGIVDFTSIPQTYKHLQIRAVTKDTWSSASSATFEVLFNSATTQYERYNYAGNGGAAIVSSSSSASSIDGFIMPTSGSGLENMFGAHVIDILDYAATNKYKHITGLTGISANQADTMWQVRILGGIWKSTNAITSIRCYDTAYQYVSGTRFSLYGIK